jgi:pyrimidine operon attenuation protein/uracil phosphoribosyltransferase
MNKQLIFNEKQIEKILSRMAAQLFELLQFHPNLKILAIQPRGFDLALVLSEVLQKKFNQQILIGKIDPSFHRDDYSSTQKLIIPNESDIPFEIENQPILLIDDVIYTGRTTRAAIDALMEMGRPKWIKLMALINRYLEREVPISVDYEGIKLDSESGQKVLVLKKENQKLEISITNG